MAESNDHSHYGPHQRCARHCVNTRRVEDGSPFSIRHRSNLYAIENRGRRERLHYEIRRAWRWRIQLFAEQRFSLRYRQFDQATLVVDVIDVLLRHFNNEKKNRRQMRHDTAIIVAQDLCPHIEVARQEIFIFTASASWSC